MQSPRMGLFTGQITSDSCTSTQSSVFSAPSYHTSDSSPAESGSSDDTAQAFPHRDIQNPAMIGPQDDLTARDGSNDKSKLRCPAPECANASFRSEKELKRHAKKHDPNSVKWYCGCCKNLGHSDKGNIRKDKVMDHLRKQHARSRCEGKKCEYIECPLDRCRTLFTANSCLNTHLEKCHPGQLHVIPTKTDNGIICDCRREAEAESVTYSHQSGANKHKADSAIEPRAKRGKYDMDIPQPLNFTPDLLAGRAPNKSSLSDFELFPINQSDFGWDEFEPYLESTHCNQSIADGETSSDTGLTYMYPESNTPYLPTYPTITAPPTQPLVYQLILDEVRLTDLFAVLEIHDFKTWAAKIRTANDGNIDERISAVAYNPERKTIILTGYPEEAVKRAKEALQNLLATYSERWGRKFLEKPTFDLQYELSESRARPLGSSSEHSDGISERQKTFPIKPKDHRRLVGMWFKHILPTLPEILDPRLGPTYTASLVRRGQIDIRAEPYIEIESPRIPGPKAQKIIIHLLDDVCAKNREEPIRVHFSQGSVKNLSGGGEKDGENHAQDCNDDRRYRFNMARPYSKLRMGASLGLSCSKKVSGTLGGYVLVDGEKYMLTSEHFITRSREPESGDGDGNDLETLTSPSRSDLGWQKGDLLQTWRDLCSDLDQQLRNQYGDRAVPVDNLSDFHAQSPERAELMEAKRRTETLIEQVTKPLTEYVIGEVFKNSVEPRAAAIPKPLADIARLPNGQRLATYHMDWSLCRLNVQEIESGEGRQEDRHENRHKYRSDSDARTDDYTEEEESNRENQAGDICCQTCSVESGCEVYYVGQGSMHRSGLVNVPCLASRDSIKTFDWMIMSSDGQKTPLSDVEGDSGSWVIKRNGNMLMGQIHSYSSGQVLFTPIDVIFDDIAKACGTEVTLPPPSFNPELATEVLPLCSIRDSPPIQPFDFLKPRNRRAAKTEQKSRIKTIPLKISRFGPLTAGQSDTIHTRNHVLSNTSRESLPFSGNLTGTSLFAEPNSGFLESSQPVNGAELSKAQGNLKRLQSKSLPNFANELVTTERPSFNLDEQSEAQRFDLVLNNFQVRSRSPVRTISNMRSLTWPVVKEGKITKIQLRLRRSRLQFSRCHELAGPLYSALFKLSRANRSSKTHDPLETSEGYFKWRSDPLLDLENASKPMNRPFFQQVI